MHVWLGNWIAQLRITESKQFVTDCLAWKPSRNGFGFPRCFAGRIIHLDVIIDFTSRQGPLLHPCREDVLAHLRALYILNRLEPPGKQVAGIRHKKKRLTNSSLQSYFYILLLFHALLWGLRFRKALLRLTGFHRFLATCFPKR